MKTDKFNLFYLLLLEDVWRVFAGLIFAIMWGPSICEGREDISLIGKIVVWIMIVVLGWSITAWPFNRILKKVRLIIKKNHKKMM